MPPIIHLLSLSNLPAWLVADSARTGSEHLYSMLFAAGQHAILMLVFDLHLLRL